MDQHQKNPLQDHERTDVDAPIVSWMAAALFVFMAVSLVAMTAVFGVLKWEDRTPPEPSPLAEIQQPPAPTLQAVPSLELGEYRAQQKALLGGYAWIDKERFHIEAKPPDVVASRYAALDDPLKSPPDEIRQMLQNLLAERFQLKVHIQQDKGRIYELLRNNRPLLLSPPKDKNAFPWTGSPEGGVPHGEGLRGRNISMPELATRLTEFLGCPVIDQTGLSGSFDFLVHSESDDTGMVLIDGISQPLRELGLELKKNTGIVYKLVVDQVSLPSSN